MASFQPSLELLETFSLAQDRRAVLKSLVPGTPEHFVFASLLAEQEGYPADLEPTLTNWASSNPRHGLTQLFANRRKLASGSEGDVLDLLRQHLHPQLDHARPQGAEDESAAQPAAPIPSVLDPSSVTQEAVVARALARLRQRGNDDVWLALQEGAPLLDVPQIVQALCADASGKPLVNALWRLPQLPSSGEECVRLVARALDSPFAKERGMQEILLGRACPALTLAQLQALAQLQPEVRSSSTWGEALLRRLAPPAGVDFRADPSALDAYLRDVAAAVEPLPPMYNVVRHAVAYHRLAALQARDPRGGAASPEGQELLQSLLSLPRPMSHVNNEVPSLQQADLRVDGAVITAGGHSLLSALAVPPPGGDEKLTRECLLAVFAQGRQPPAEATALLAPWDAWLNPSYLRAVMAEARLTRGAHGDREAAHEWMNHLRAPGGAGAGGLQALSEASHLTLHATREYFRPGDDVALSVSVKNSGPALAVRVFEVNTSAWYAEKGAEIQSDFNTDGLVPRETLTVPLPPNASPLLDHHVALPLPSLSGHVRGVFIVEVVAGGVSSRALIRKGQLRVVERLSVAGHVLSLMDEDNQPLPPSLASVTLGGRRYAAASDSSDGGIVIPFAVNPSSTPLVVTLQEAGPDGTESSGWSFSCLHAPFTHQSESYSLEAAFHVEREALVAGNYAAALLVRPRLLLHGTLPAPLRALTNVCLTLSSIDASGAASERVVRPFRLHADKESVLPFAVPPTARSMTFTLTGDMEVLATGAKQSLSASHSVQLNGIDGTDATRDLHLRCTASDGFALYALGKAGEPLAGGRVRLWLTHGLVREPHEAELVTDAAGRVVLGQLGGFTSVRAALGDSEPVEFELPRETAAYATAVHTTSSESVQARVPFRPAQGVAPGYRLSRRDATLVEVHPAACGTASAPYGGPCVSSTPVADCFDALSFDAATGFIVVKGLGPGEYQLTVRRAPPSATGPAPAIAIRVLPGGPSTRLRCGHLLSGNTFLQLRGVEAAGASALSVSAPVVGSDGGVSVRVCGGGAGARVGSDVRVHVLATTFVPHWDAGSALASLSVPGLSVVCVSPPRSRFLNGRKLGEEQRYILDRHALLEAGKVRPGNSLPRPQLLLNPWSLGTVSTDVQAAKEGDAYASMSEGVSSSLMRGGAARYGRESRGGVADHASHVNVDWLASPAVLLANLRPDPATGLVTVPREDLLSESAAAAGAGELFLTVVAVDAVNTAAAACPVSLSQPHSAPRAGALGPYVRDLLASRPHLNPSSHVLQQSRVTVLASPGASCTVSSTGTRVEAYASLDRALTLLSSLGGGPLRLLHAEFSWLLQWPRLSEAERGARYSKYACHELHLFLAAKDPAFFETVVVPYLQCKRSKSFMDHWLLGHDMAPYTAPHAYEQLNAAERALLAGYAGADAAAGVVRRIRDWVEAHPLSGERREAIFAAALASSALDEKAASQEEVAALLQQAEQESRARRAEAASGGPSMAKRKMAGGAMMYGANGHGRQGAPMMAQAAPMPRAAMTADGRFDRRMMMAAPAPVPMAMSMAPMAMPMHESRSLSAFMDAAPSMMMADASMQEGLQADSDMAAREASRDSAAVYRPVDKTEEFAEAHYWRVRAEDDRPGLVGPCAFWADLAAYMASTVQPAVAAAASPAARRAGVQAALASSPFVSAHFAQCSGSLTEALLAVAVLGLPFEADDARPPQPPRAAIVEGSDGGGLRFTAQGTPAVLFHRDLAEVDGIGASAPGAPPPDDGIAGAGAGAAVLVGQSYFDPSDRYETVRGMQVERHLPRDAQFAPGKVYGCTVVMSNITPRQMSLEALLHIPAGSLPVVNGEATRTHAATVGGFSTVREEYLFYFPATGTYTHYPVHVSCEGVLLAHAQPATLEVAQRPVRRDAGSWAYMAAAGSQIDVLAHLATANSSSTDLDLLLWRCRASAPFWRQLVSLLRGRGWFHEGVWAYALLHGGDDMTLREYLSRPSLIASLRSLLLGPIPVLTTPLLTLRGEAGVGTATGDVTAGSEPALPRGGLGGDSGAYEHLEYSPLVNARAHQLGASRRVPNKAVERQWRALLRVLCAKRAGDVSPADLSAVTYHLLLQDRVDDALQTFARVLPPQGSVAAAAAVAGPGATASSSATTAASWSTLQYDYMAAYLDFYRTDGATFPVAAAVARAYASHPVPKWAARFTEIATQLREAGVHLGPVQQQEDGVGGDRAAPAALGSGVSGEESGLTKELAREAAQSRAAASEPALELALGKGAALELTYANVSAVTMRFYRVDLELLFSSSPFALGPSGDGSGGPGEPRPLGGAAGSAPTAKPGALGQFAFVRPTHSLTVQLPPLAPGAAGTHSVPLPAGLASSNVMVEVVGAGAASGLRRTLPYFASRMSVTMTESMGRLRVVGAPGGADGAAAVRPLPRVYVKVYWRGASPADGSKGTFLKDGYTDARGVFDYASVSTSELASAARLALLVTSPEHGAIVREVNPPR